MRTTERKIIICTIPAVVGCIFHILWTSSHVASSSSSANPGDYCDNNIWRRSMNIYIRNRNGSSLECLTLGHTARALNGAPRTERLYN